MFHRLRIHDLSLIDLQVFGMEIIVNHVQYFLKKTPLYSILMSKKIVFQSTADHLQACAYVVTLVRP